MRLTIDEGGDGLLHFTVIDFGIGQGLGDRFLDHLRIVEILTAAGLFELFRGGGMKDILIRIDLLYFIVAYLFASRVLKRKYKRYQSSTSTFDAERALCRAPCIYYYHSMGIKTQQKERDCRLVLQSN